MRVLWLAIIGVSLVPVAIAGLVANPLVFLVLGPEGWRDRVERLLPYRRWSCLDRGLALATVVYTLRYG